MKIKAPHLTPTEKSLGFKNQQGQSVVEAVLIMVALFGFVTVVSQGLRQNEIIATLVSGPWQNLSGLIQNGAWAPPHQSMHLHPNNHRRHITFRGDPGR